jgi:DNA-binding response OmpR family regulator
MQKKVVIAEDDPDIQDVLKLIFEGAGYDTVIFSTGSALLAADVSSPDIFVIDKRLPGMDGLDVCIELKKGQLTSKVPVIILSATPHIQNLVAIAGADAFIEKPFSRKHLLETMASLINIRKQSPH